MKENEIKKNDKKISNTVIKGLVFLFKSIHSQWKMLFSVSAIFLIVVFSLAGFTMFFDMFGKNTHFGGEGISSYNPEEIAKHTLSFSDAVWWTFITISTVGYGDIYPITMWMRIWAIFISLIGLAFVAIYTAVIVNGFTTEIKKIKTKNLEIEIFNDEQKIKKLELENTKLKKELKKETKKQNKTLE